jgi:F-type H+-transporting ATPase subunit delta
MSVAKKYAKALFDVTHESGKSADTAALKTALQSFWSVIEGSRELQVALVSPVTSYQEKAAVIDELARKLETPKICIQFLKLLGENSRVGALPLILDALDEVRLQSEGGVMGRIVSADPLDASAVKEIAEAFTQKLKKKVEFKVSSDSSLLAGIKVTLNGVTYDGTLRAQLERLRESFASSGQA